MQRVLLILFLFTCAVGALDPASARRRCELEDAGSADADMIGAWSALNLPLPAVLLTSGAAYASASNGSDGGTPLRRSSWALAQIAGTATAQPCGMRCRSLGVHALTLRLPEANAWTASLWLQTLAADATLRDVPADGTFVLALEDGVLVAGSPVAPLLRSAARVADGRWHHVAVVATAANLQPERGSEQPLALYVDGIPHGHASARGLPRFSELAISAFVTADAAADTRDDIFVDELAVFSSPLSAEDVARLHGAQQPGFDAAACFPAMPWRMEAAPPLPPPPPPLLPPPPPARTGAARVAVLILSDGRPASAEARAAVRSGWLQLARGRPVRHVFCISAPLDSASPPASAINSALAAEAALYRDLLFVDGDEDYRTLTSKVLRCFRALAAAAESRSGGGGTSAAWLNPPAIGTFDFVVKTDHDVFLRIDTLQRELVDELAASSAAAAADLAAVGRAPPPLLSWRGFAYTSIPPLRHLLDKNADTTYPFMSFPPYTAGVAVVLSAALLREVLRLRVHALPLNEDQALGVWIARREIEFGAAPVVPLHDIRFQQWPVCTPRQLAVHPADRADMRLLLGNVAAGRALCDGLGRGNCCLCCAHCEPPGNWFVCDDVRGASLPDFDAVEELLRLRAADTAAVRTPAKLLALIRTAAAQLLAALPPEASRGDGGGSSSGSSGGRLVGLSCAWQPAAWYAAGLGNITAVAAARIPEAAAETLPLGGVAVSCRDGAPGMPAHAPCPADNPADCAGARALDAMCGASLVFTAAAAQHGGAGAAACAAAQAPGVRPLHDAAAPAPGAATAFGALREPAATCDEHGAPHVEPLALLLLRTARRRWRAAAALRKEPEEDRGHRRRGDKKEDAVDASAALPPDAARWIVLAATVDTAGACTLAGVAPRAREAAVSYAESDLPSLRSYPRAGAAAAQCALVVDVVHADGRVTVRRSPLARDAEAHLHYELLRVTHAAPIAGLVVTLLLPPDGAAPAPVSVRDLRVAELRLPRRLLPPGRAAAEPWLAEHAEAALRADRRLLPPAEGAGAAVSVQRGDVAELPPLPPLAMPACAADARRRAAAAFASAGLQLSAVELVSAAVAIALLLCLVHVQRRASAAVRLRKRLRAD